MAMDCKLHQVYLQATAGPYQVLVTSISLASKHVTGVCQALSRFGGLRYVLFFHVNGDVPKNYYLRGSLIAKGR